MVATASFITFFSAVDERALMRPEVLKELQRWLSGVSSVCFSLSVFYLHFTLVTHPTTTTTCHALTDPTQHQPHSDPQADTTTHRTTTVTVRHSGKHQYLISTQNQSRCDIRVVTKVWSTQWSLGWAMSGLCVRHTDIWKPREIM